MRAVTFSHAHRYLKPKDFMIAATVSFHIFIDCKVENVIWPYSPLVFPELIPIQSTPLGHSDLIYSFSVANTFPKSL